MHGRDWLGEEGADGIKLEFYSGDIEDGDIGDFFWGGGGV